MIKKTKQEIPIELFVPFSVSKVKRKVVANKKLLAPLVEMLFKLICEMPEDEEDEIFETNEIG
jgi:hypothetical protein